MCSLNIYTALHRIGYGMTITLSIRQVEQLLPLAIERERRKKRHAKMYDAIANFVEWALI